MFPYVERQQRCQSVGQRILGIGALSDQQLAVLVARKPYPTGTEQSDSCIDEHLFKRVERSEIAIYGLTQSAAGFTSAIRRESEEIEDMVPCLRCVVEQCTFSVADNILQFSVFKLGAFDQSAEIVDIGFFMFALV